MVDTYGERLAHARDELGLTQEQFALRIGIPTRTLQDIEAGKVTRPQRLTREKIDSALNLQPEGATAAEWPPDLRAFLELLGAFLFALPEDARTGYVQGEIKRLARWNVP